ncbi:hypothetical protein HHX47_DHR1001851 [Lentinula edodes]|nr:hypothetical protein HHX47_DHR1001851 [Lentinula edodes]
MGTSLRNPVDKQLSFEAEDAWHLDCCGSPDGIEDLENTIAKLKDAGLGHTVEWLDTEAQIIRRVPQLAGSDIQLCGGLKGWKGIFFEQGGWLAAAKAIDSVGRELVRHGVQFSFGDSGTFQSLILSNDGKTCLGATTKDGTRYIADRVVLASGAWSPSLVDLEDQCCSKAWVYAHMQLTSEEIKEYADCPVVYNEDLGFFFEPDESHARHPTDTYPDASEITINKAIAALLPKFKDKELFNRAMCWCADTADANLLICEHPRWKIGKHVVELLEGTLQEDLRESWRWRPGFGDARKSRRAAPAEDLADLPGWKHDPAADTKMQANLTVQ